MSPAESHAQLAKLAAMLDGVQDYFTNELVGGIGPLADKPESYAFVGRRIEDALAQLAKGRALFPERSTPRFLDCGSGLGFIATLAKGLGFAATGLEWSEQYVTLARKLFPSTKTVQGDVLEFEYGDFDVVYYYGPFADEALQQRFEEKVEAELKSGGVILANRKSSDAWRATNQFELLSEDGYMDLILRKR
jgi:SAM-dependent methyltransferase